MNALDKIWFSLRAAKDTGLGYAFWYGILALAMWALLYVVLRKFLQHRKISKHWPKRAQMTREFWQSLRSIIVFSVVTVLIVFAALSGWTRLYPHIDRYGWVWYFVSIGIMILMHDAYFYWTHRAMHHRALYRHFHRTHHQSLDPTPWAAYSFSPLEALVQAGIGPLIIFTLPCHPSAFAIFMLWQISFNVFGHCGYELYPRWFLNSPIGFLLNSPTHHTLHHEQFVGNFSLYFNLWDRLFGTNCPEYAERFEKVTAGAQEQPNALVRPSSAVLQK
jgi:Delta7-sterol 5-desaturase